MSFSFDKITTGTYNFVSVTLNFATDVATISGLPSCAFLVVISAKTHFFDQVKINSTSHLISAIFELLQKLLKYFGGTTSFMFVNKSLFSGVSPVYLFYI